MLKTLSMLYEKKYVFLSLGCSPLEENCVMVNSEKPYLDEMKEEQLRFKQLLEKTFFIPEVLKNYLFFEIVSQEHDFSTYLETYIIFDKENFIKNNEEKFVNLNIERILDFLVMCENNIPNKWDEQLNFKFNIEY